MKGTYLRAVVRLWVCAFTLFFFCLLVYLGGMKWWGQGLQRHLLYHFQFLLHNLLQQSLVTFNHFINHIFAADGLKMLSCTVDF